MKYVYNIKRSADLTPAQLTGVLPSHFLLREEGKRLAIVIEGELAEEQVYCKIQRECDRIFFLTEIQLDPCLVRVERPDGTRVRSEQGFGCCGIEQLPSDLDRQQWTPILEIQLRLWQLAHVAYLPISVQIILLYQIIEIESSEKPPLKKDAGEKRLWKEAKLIRHWVSHQGKIVNGELKSYIGGDAFFNPTNAVHQQIIPKLHEKVKKEAEKIITLSLTRKAPFHHRQKEKRLSVRSPLPVRR